MLGNSNRLDSEGDEKIDGLGLTVGEMQAVARRQLAGSVVVGILLLCVAAIIGFRSVHYAAPDHSIARSGVQNPVFVAPPDHVVAAAKRKIEAP